MSGNVEYGRCDVCGKEAVLGREYYSYNIKCECHSPNHFEIVRHCADCEPKEPRETRITLTTDVLKKTVIDIDNLEHLLNCMCNQKYIHEQSPDVQKEWQEIIDKAYHEARGPLSGIMAQLRSPE